MVSKSLYNRISRWTSDYLSLLRGCDITTTMNFKLCTIQNTISKILKYYFLNTFWTNKRIQRTLFRNDNNFLSLPLPQSISSVLKVFTYREIHKIQNMIIKTFVHYFIHIYGWFWSISRGINEMNAVQEFLTKRNHSKISHATFA